MGRLFASSFSKTQSLPRQPPPSSSSRSSSPSPSSTPEPAWGPQPPSSQTVVEPAPPPWEPRAAQEIRTARPAATAPALDPPRGRAPPMPGAAWEMAAAARRAGPRRRARGRQPGGHISSKGHAGASLSSPRHHRDLRQRAHLHRERWTEGEREWRKRESGGR